MKNLLRSLLVVLAMLLILGGFKIRAQQTIIDQIVTDNINLRRKAEIYKASRRNGKTNRSKVTKTAPRNASTSKKAEPAKLAEIYLAMDMYQTFAAKDAKGFTVNFIFTPTGTGGADFAKTYNYNTDGNRSTKFSDIPAGIYVLKAEAARINGKKYPVYLGTELGEPTNPRGGNFSPSLKIEVKPGKDSYGRNILQSSPGSLYFRVIE